MRRLTSSVVATLTTCTVVLGGCSAGDLGAGGSADDEKSLIGRIAQSAGIPGGLTPWTPPVAICFTHAGTGTGRLSDPDYATLKTWTMNIVTANWGLVSGLTFQNAGDCPQNTAGKMRIDLYQGNGGGQCGLGLNAQCYFSGNTSGGPNPPDWFASTVIHEVGHGLGMYHEHQRIDHGPLCSGVQAQLTACTTCKTQFDSGQSCPADTYNACVKPGTLAVGPQWGTDPCPPPDANGACGVCLLCLANKYQEVQAPYDNNVSLPACSPTVTTGCIRLMTWYDPLSVMNYCAVDNGRQGIRPTELDLLGMKMIYPSSLSHKLGCAEGCFKTGSGDAVVNGIGSVTVDWTELGALGINASWHVGAWNGTGVTLGASHISTGTVTFDYVDWKNRTHTGSASVVKSDAVFTAILESTTAAALL